MSGVVETTEVDPKQAVGRLLPEGWRVKRTKGCEGGTLLFGHDDGASYVRRVDHGELVEVVIEDTPADDVTGDVRQAVQ